MKKTLQWMVLFYVFGTCVGYQIVLSTLASYVAQSIGASVEFTSSAEFRAFVNIPIAAIVVMPLSMMRDLSSLAFASVLSLLALTYTGIVMYVELPWYNKLYRDMPTTKIEFLHIKWSFFTACAMTFFAYTCQLQLLPIYSELVRPSYRRIKMVVTRSLAIDFMFYASIASAGYWSTYSASPSVIITRAPLPNFNPDYAMLIAACSLCLVIFAAFPCNYNPFRSQFFTLILRQPNYNQKA